MRTLLLLSLALLAAGCAATRPAGNAGFAATDTLSFVTLNLWHDQHDWPARLEVVLDTLGAIRPDVICLQEVLQDEDLENQAQAIAEALGYRRTFSSVDPPDQPRRYGNAILFRHPFTEADAKKLEPLDDYRTVARTVVEVGGAPLNVYCTHLHHTMEGGEIRATQVRDLLGYVRATRRRAPVLLAGDFNAPVDTPEITLVTEAGFADAFGALHPAADSVTTLNVALGHTPRRIDHVFYEPSAFRPVEARLLFAEPTPEGVWATDHFGVLVRFTGAE